MVALQIYAKCCCFCMGVWFFFWDTTKRRSNIQPKMIRSRWYQKLNGWFHPLCLSKIGENEARSLKSEGKIRSYLLRKLRGEKSPISTKNEAVNMEQCRGKPQVVFDIDYSHARHARQTLSWIFLGRSQLKIQQTRWEGKICKWIFYPHVGARDVSVHQTCLRANKRKKRKMKLQKPILWILGNKLKITMMLDWGLKKMLENIKMR